MPGEAWTIESGLSPFRVICPEHGPVHLDGTEYLHQLDRPNRPWRCPRCGSEAAWDDPWYEGFLNAQDAADPPTERAQVSLPVSLVRLAIQTLRLAGYDSMADSLQFLPKPPGSVCRFCLKNVDGDRKHTCAVPHDKR